MSTSHLPTNFALQSVGPISARTNGARLLEAVITDSGRGLAIWLEPGRRCDTSTTLRVTGLLSRRFYRLDGAQSGFARADNRGVLTVSLMVRRRALLTLQPVV